MRIELLPFSCKKDDWMNWSSVKRSNAAILGCTEAFKLPSEQAVKSGDRVRPIQGGEHPIQDCGESMENPCLILQKYRLQRQHVRDFREDRITQ